MTYCEPGLSWIYGSGVDWVLDHIIHLLMDTVSVSETLVYLNRLTRLSAQEYFTECS